MIHVCHRKKLTKIVPMKSENHTTEGPTHLNDCGPEHDYNLYGLYPILTTDRTHWLFMFLNETALTIPSPSPPPPPPPPHPCSWMNWRLKQMNSVAETQLNEALKIQSAAVDAKRLVYLPHPLYASVSSTTSLDSTETSQILTDWLPEVITETWKHDCIMPSIISIVEKIEYVSSTIWRNLHHGTSKRHKMLETYWGSRNRYNVSKPAANQEYQQTCDSLRHLELKTNFSWTVVHSQFAVYCTHSKNQNRDE